MRSEKLVKEELEESEEESYDSDLGGSSSSDE